MTGPEVSCLRQVEGITMYQAPVDGGAPVGRSRSFEIECEARRAVQKETFQMPSDPRYHIESARNLLKLRNSRNARFGGELFSDPAWDILLALYVSKLQQVRVKITSVIEASGVPPTTGLRWITSLIERGLVIRSANPTDARSSFLELSDGSASLVTLYLADCRASVADA